MAERKRGLCRWCGAAVPKGRLTFCSAACVHEWKLRTQAGYLRECVFKRDRGVCAACGIDAIALRRDKRKLDYAARKRFEREWGMRRHLWDADHIVPVAEGGGECDLSNVRTLCVTCHRAATARLRERLARKRLESSAGPTHEADPAEATMPGKKAHKPRIVKDAGTHGIHRDAAQGNKSTGETEGFAGVAKGRRGQGADSGNSPITKK